MLNNSITDARLPKTVTSQVSTKCENAFSNYQDASCVVYNDIDCEDKAFGIGLMAGEKQSFDPVQNNIKAMSVQQGCSIQIFTGKSVYYSITDFQYVT